jgi:hypothetical protein
MRVLTTNPIVFPDGDILAPEDLNAGSLYLKDALIDVSQKRWAHGIMVIPFVADVATPYTDAMLGTEQLVFRFFCAQTCVVERGYLSADMVSTADVQWSWTKTSGGRHPDGLHGAVVVDGRCGGVGDGGHDRRERRPLRPGRRVRVPAHDHVGRRVHDQPRRHHLARRRRPLQHDRHAHGAQPAAVAVRRRPTQRHDAREQQRGAGDRGGQAREATTPP